MGPASPEHSLQGECAHVRYPDVTRVLRDLQERGLQTLQSQGRALSPTASSLTALISSLFLTVGQAVASILS